MAASGLAVMIWGWSQSSLEPESFMDDDFQFEWFDCNLLLSLCEILLEHSYKDINQGEIITSFCFVVTAKSRYSKAVFCPSPEFTRPGVLCWNGTDLRCYCTHIPPRIHTNELRSFNTTLSFLSLQPTHTRSLNSLFPRRLLRLWTSKDPYPSTTNRRILRYRGRENLQEAPTSCSSCPQGHKDIWEALIWRGGKGSLDLWRDVRRQVRYKGLREWKRCGLPYWRISADAIT